MSKEEKFTGAILGEVVMHPLGSVKPNPWNPNLMTKAQRRALELSLREGWLASNALTVWGTDDEGRIKNVIIDGEQRWAVAKSMGFEECPMVVLQGLSESRAKDLTIRLDGRGSFDRKKLGKLLIEQERQPSLFPTESIESRYALSPEDVDMAKSLAGQAKAAKATNGTNGGETSQESAPTSAIRMVQLFFTPEQHEEFMRIVRTAAPNLGTNNITDAVLAIVRAYG